MPGVDEHCVPAGDTSDEVPAKDLAVVTKETGYTDSSTNNVG